MSLCSSLMACWVTLRSFWRIAVSLYNTMNETYPLNCQTLKGKSYFLRRWWRCVTWAVSVSSVCRLLDSTVSTKGAAVTPDSDSGTLCVSGASSGFWTGEGALKRYRDTCNDLMFNIPACRRTYKCKTLHVLELSAGTRSQSSLCPLCISPGVMSRKQSVSSTGGQWRRWLFPGWLNKT